MIHDIVEAQCDKCGRTNQVQKILSSTPAGLTPSLEEIFKALGWKFIRDDKHELKRVLCAFCVSKEEKG